MMIEEVEKELQALGNPKQAILCGIEAHACIAVNTYHCFIYSVFILHTVGQNLFNLLKPLRGNNVTCVIVTL